MGCEVEFERSRYANVNLLELFSLQMIKATLSEG